MRIFLASALLIAACSPGQDNATTPTPEPTAPAPKTPLTDIRPEPGNSAGWMAPADNGSDPKDAPYGDLLDQPLVNGNGAQ